MTLVLVVVVVCLDRDWLTVGDLIAVLALDLLRSLPPGGPGYGDRREVGAGPPAGDG